MTHVVSLSGGVTSWMAGRLVVDRIVQPGDEIVLLFADTLIESPDVYRFLEAGAEDIGHPVTRIADGRTPWQVFHDERMLGNNARALCSRVLKRTLIDRWRKKHCDQETSRHYIGLDWTEINRFEGHRDALARTGWTAIAPMIDFHVSKHDAMSEARLRGLPLPNAYREGFGHANCGGMCVRAGIGHWSRLYRVHPDRFEEAERQESALRSKLGDFSILRDRTGGTSRVMPLSELRRRLDEQPAGLDFEEEGGCGCAVEGAP